MPKINDIKKYIQNTTGCSGRVAQRSARKCFFDKVWAFKVLSIEMYHQLYGDPTGETATNNVMKEQVAA